MLQIKELSKSYGEKTALKGINLELKPGLFGLLGPNGAGKSTLMRTLATLQPPDSGVITYKDINIVDHPDVMRRVLGYLPQEFGVYPKMTAQNLLEHIAVLKGVHNKSDRDSQISSLLELVNLSDQRHHVVASFSGGMRQRFGVAQALLAQPEVLIVDEPTAGLDPFERQRFLDLLSETAHNKVVILSTHIVEDVRDMCADMAIMSEGKIVARGDPEGLIARVSGKLWRISVEKNEVDKLKEHHDVLSTRLLMGKVVVSVLSDDQPESGFEQDKPNLEDAYFAHLYALLDEA